MPKVYKHVLQRMNKNYLGCGQRPRWEIQR